MIKNIIFDFDGVLVESMDIKARGFAYLFKDYPGHVDEIVRFHLAHGGMGRFEKIDRIYKEMLGKTVTEEQKKELGMKFSKFVYDEVVGCPFVKGAKEFLHKYHEQFRFFVVSGTPDEEIKSIVKERGLDRYFVGVYGSPRKKSELNREIVARYGFKEEETVCVGDSIDDYEGVKGTRIKFVGRIVEEDPFKGLKIEARIKDVSELEEVIEHIV